MLFLIFNVAFDKSYRMRRKKKRKKDDLLHS